MKTHWRDRTLLHSQSYFTLKCYLIQSYHFSNAIDFKVKLVNLKSYFIFLMSGDRKKREDRLVPTFAIKINLSEFNWAAPLTISVRVKHESTWMAHSGGDFQAR